MISSKSSISSGQTDQGASRSLRLPPSIIVYDGPRALHGRRLNRFALSIRDAENRRKFVADEESYMRAQGLTEKERAMVRRRDWLEIVIYGGNMYAIIKVARALGISQARVGAQMRGEDFDAFMASRPVGPTGIASRDDLGKWRK